MKRNTLTTAVMAGLTGVAGMMSVANAVNINPDGLGQVLLYPYYTTRGGNDTLISVVNTTSNAKSVKIRFLEGRNSREVLDFNIYLSAYDVWTGALTEQPGSTPETTGTYLITRDTTCTVPYFYGESAAAGDDPVVGRVDFKDFEFISFPPPVDVDNTDRGGSDLERVQSGYFEVIEMGTLVDDATDETDPFGFAPTISRNSATAVTHTDGVPADCQQLVDAWTPRENNPNRPFDLNSYFLPGEINPDTGEVENPDFAGFGPFVDHESPSGGLFGAASIVNVNEGTLLSYNAEAIDNWTTRVEHTDPGRTKPTLVDGSVLESAVFISGTQTVRTAVWNNAAQSVNAVLMNNEVMNEYAINPLLEGKTEWVVTFPTKRFHVDPAIVTTAINPFSVVFGSDEDNPGSCEPVTFRLWDREEGELREEAPGSGGVIPSPRPPGFTPEPETFDLCWEANVIRFVDEDATTPGNTEILGENRFSTIPLPVDIVGGEVTGFSAGWMQLSFDPESIDPALGFPADARRQSSLDGDDYVGLPVIGFQAATISNNTLIVDGEAVLSNYGGTFKHRGSRRIELTPTP